MLGVHWLKNARFMPLWFVVVKRWSTETYIVLILDSSYLKLYCYAQLCLRRRRGKEEAHKIVVLYYQILDIGCSKVSKTRECRRCKYWVSQMLGKMKRFSLTRISLFHVCKEFNGPNKFVLEFFHSSALIFVSLFRSNKPVTDSQMFTEPLVNIPYV